MCAFPFQREVSDLLLMSVPHTRQLPEKMNHQQEHFFLSAACYKLLAPATFLPVKLAISSYSWSNERGPKNPGIY